MDTVRRRYGNTSVRRRNYRYDNPVKEKKTYAAQVIKQTIACIILGTLLVGVGTVKSVGTDAFIGGVRYALGYSVEYSVVLENIQKAYNKIMGVPETVGEQNAPI